MRRWAAWLAAAGLTLQACSSVTPPSPSTTPEPTIGAPASPTVNPTSGPATAAGSDWGRITADEQPALGDRIGSASMVAVAARGNDVVAVGEISGTGAAAWYSPDGFAWSRARFPSPKTSRLRDVVATDTGYVAVGAANGAVAAWTSPDGRSWTLVSIEGGDGAILRRVARGGPGLVALSGWDEDSSFEDGAIWSSVDGTHWSVLAGRSAIQGPAQVSALAGLPSGIVMAGAAAVDHGWTAAVWRSSDGRAWTRAPDPPHGGIVNDIVAFDDLLVAVGRGPDELSGPAAWIERDGEAWESASAIPGSTSERQVYLTAVARGSRGLVAVGPSPEGTVGVWTSADGLEWIRIPNGGGLAGPEEWRGTYQAADLTAGGPGIVIVGRFPRTSWPETGSAAVWTNPSPPAGPAPSPTPLACPSTSHLAAVDVLDVSPADRVTCFGGAKLSFTAFVGPGPDEGIGPPTWLTDDSPYWLYPISVSGFGEVLSMLGYRDPRLAAPPLGRWFIVSGHFDDPRAASCPADDPSTPPELTVTGCRQRFVMTGLVPGTGP